MKVHRRIVAIASVLIAGTTASFAGRATDAIADPLVGTWTLVAADVIHADGSRSGD